MNEYVQIERCSSKKMIVRFLEEAQSSNGYNFLNLTKKDTEQLTERVVNVLFSMNSLADVQGDYGAYSEEIVAKAFGDKKILGLARANGRMKIYLLENKIINGAIQLTESQCRVLANLLKGYVKHYNWKQ